MSKVSDMCIDGPHKPKCSMKSSLGHTFSVRIATWKFPNVASTQRHYMVSAWLQCVPKPEDPSSESAHVGRTHPIDGRNKAEIKDCAHPVACRIFKPNSITIHLHLKSFLSLQH